ncbi:MAG: tRNA (guanosine(37)-N1)-methyltransferase TrmD [Proteobacteria bacterium]|nr:tRNA (guanosine(37)-N1)-methyltransferase TrmD [Desulfobulbaceae bacterium]MBU4151404.1 tRNA (guanosine(37)-N1)-methyltransferase TrmD [Pseudomonadota bacterium]MDP2104589.1 tRNA (guanosine(37)-N1)-methyltransferase TrmD [Desulfobulbaceae bacterium]
MRVDVLTIFPDLFVSPLEEGIISRALAASALSIEFHNIRDYALGKHAVTDDRPFGGGEGMVMKPEPIVAALQKVESEHPGGHVVFLTPQGRPYTQKVASDLAQKEHLILLCGRYEGVDARVEAYFDDEISIGDYVLTGGELAALVVIDSVTRLLPGVLGCSDSAECDTFSRGLLKHPQYTRPRQFEGIEVPEALLSGDHQAIADWRLVESVKRTRARRPDLIELALFSRREMKMLRRQGIDVSDLVTSMDNGSDA